MLIECLKDLTPFGTALDLGCGCGVVGLVLSKLGFKNVTSTDVSAAAIELTKENAR
jgi:16S rRNA (guanine1207-N2)-methyltransferase